MWNRWYFMWQIPNLRVRAEIIKQLVSSVKEFNLLLVVVLRKKVECLAKQLPSSQPAGTEGKLVEQSGFRELQSGPWHLQTASGCVSHLAVPPLVLCPPTHTAAPCLVSTNVQKFEERSPTVLWPVLRQPLEHVLFTKYCSKYPHVPRRTEVWGNKGNRRRFLAFLMNCRKGRRVFLA